MSVLNINSVVHLCEDTSKQFDVASILAAAGYTATLPMSISQMFVLDPVTGLPVAAPAGLFTLVDGHTIKVDASVYPDRNWSFNTLTIVLDAGPNEIDLKLQVVVDPVNDAPIAQDHTLSFAALGNITSYTIHAGDLGFSDPHDATAANQANPAGNNLKGMIITSLPGGGALLLSGVAVTVGQEISAADLAAGHLVYKSSSSISGSMAIGFEVQDDGGLVGCGAADTSTEHHLTFIVPPTDTHTSALGDYLFFDANHNGLQDSNEHGYAGDKVNLMGAGADGKFGTADDVVIASTTTDANGSYHFTGLAAGNYQVQFGTSANYGATLQHVGTNTAIDSDADVNGRTQTVTLGIGEVNNTIDAGLYQIDTKTASLGDRVWYDANHNGIQDAGETGAPAGQWVALFGAGADGQFGTKDDMVAQTTYTDANGNYHFNNLAAGTYEVEFSNLANGYAYTTQHAGANSAIDSDANAGGLSQVVTLGIGESNQTIDAGIVGTGSIGDRVWYDANHNGIQDAGENGAANQWVALYGAGADGKFGTADDLAAQVTYTDANGNYSFISLLPGAYEVQFSPTLTAGYAYTTSHVGTNGAIDSDASAAGLSQVLNLAAGQSNTTIDAGIVGTGSIGDRVWYDANHNGIQDAGENGAANQWVALYGAGADGKFGTADDLAPQVTYTDANGNYSFTNLLPGAYEVQFSPTLTAGYAYTTAHVGTNGAIDSDASAAGLSQVLNLAAGQSNTTIDAGIVGTGSIGDRVWLDQNHNGIQDAGEKGIANQWVALYGAGKDGIFGTSDDMAPQTVYTDANGNYSFTNLLPGTYEVQFSNLASGYAYTTAHVGTNGAIDSDASAAGLSQTVTLAAGQSNTTIDAGVIDTDTAYIGDKIFQVQVAADGSHSNSQNLGFYDKGVNLATIQLWGAGADGQFGTSDDVHASTKTDLFSGTDTGAYGFGYLAAGLYKVHFDLPSYSAFVAKNVGDAAHDSDVNPLTGWTDVFSLAAGEHNMTIDAGIYNTAGSPIAFDLDGNGVQTTALAQTHGTFDILGNGSQLQSGWLSSGDGFLAIDSNGNGKIDGLSELFGGTVGQGFAKLVTYDTNHDGVVDSKDADFSKLLVWQDLNGDHQSSANELRTLAQVGIASLKVAYTDQSIEQNGNFLGETSSATKADGSSIEMTDVYFQLGTSVTTANATAASAAVSVGTSALSHLLEPAQTLDLPHDTDSAGTVSASSIANADHHVSLNHDALSQLTSLWAKAGAHIAMAA